MVVLVIEVDDFSFSSVDSECHPPVSRDSEAPCALAVARELVNFPAWNVPELLDILHLLKEGHDVADLLDNRERKAGNIVTFDELTQSPMGDIADFHEE